MQAVDTNVLVRALTGDDPVQSPVAAAFISDNGPVWVSHVVLVETVWVLESVYDCGKPQLVEALKRIIDNKDLALEEPTVARAALANYQGKTKASFDDCLILEIARKAGHVPLATFDKALGKSEGANLLKF
jgi:predicted nucleic-acid-binding protein